MAYSFRCCLPLVILSSSVLIARVKQCLVNLTGVHQVAAVPCANIDLKEWVKKERVGHEDPSEMEQGLHAPNVVRGRACLMCVLCLFSRLESHPCPGDVCLASDFHNEDGGSFSQVEL